MYTLSLDHTSSTKSGNNNHGDTTLRLDCFGYGSQGGSRTATSNLSNKQPSSHGALSNSPDDGCKLVLGLGPTPSSYTSIFPSYGSVTETSNLLEFSDSRVSPNGFALHVDDEGSTSGKKTGGYMTKLILAPKMAHPDIPSMAADENPLTSEPSGISTFTLGGSSTTCSSSGRKLAGGGAANSNKKCKFPGCTKGARGATGLCIGHGGGQRCAKPGCNKGAESRTAYCKAHGGGRRCQHLGCTKSAEGRTDHCIAHGGGRRCTFPEGCTKAARGKSGLCIKHGGGKRCKVDNCSRSAEGHVGLCISHGGGRRCQFPACGKGAQGSTTFCKAHGGGKRCVFAGCNKGAEGSTPLCKGHGGGKRCMHDGGGICSKSVHGGTNFCVAHGGGKRCAVSGCTKSARGKTPCCVKHGGGKRCKVDKCDKSAQGSTDFCKAHGGGKRCAWAADEGRRSKCEKFARGKSGLCAAHTSLVQGRAETTTGGGKGGLIGPGLFRGLVPCGNENTTCSSSGLSMLSDSTTDSFGRANEKRQKLIPPQVLVPLSMKWPVPSCSEKRAEEMGCGDNGPGFSVPEGRVHGGGLLSFLRRDVRGDNSNAGGS